MSVKTPKSLRAYYDSELFEADYLYDGPLGPDYSREGTRLRLWAPTAEQVMLNLYRQGTRATVSAPWPWSAGNTAAGPSICRGISTGCTTPSRCGQRPDPGNRGPLRPGGGGQRQPQHDCGPAPHRPQRLQFDRRPIIPASRRVIWEVSVRDFSWDPQRRVFPALAGQIPGLHPGGHHPGGEQHLPHRPELPAAAGGQLHPADAGVRLRQRG